MYHVSTVVLSWEVAYARAYKIQVSDDAAGWTDVYSTATGGGGVETVTVGRTARYVRMQGVTPNTQYGYSLYELEVDGSATSSGSGPTFYVDAGYSGTAVALGAGSYDLPQLQAAGIANDSISSIRVPAGFTVTAYADAGFAGTAWTFTTDDPNLVNTGNNDAISSLRITTTTGGGGTGAATTAPSTTYPQTYSDWANGLLAGNGKQGIIVFGNPRNETVVFDDKRFFMARTEAQPHRTFNTVSQDNIQRIRDLLIAGQYQQANQLAADVQGYQGGGEGSKHPGFKMTLQMPDSGPITNYVRSADYASGVVSVNWADDTGRWERDSFVSRTDGVTVQYLPAPTGQRLTVKLGLSIDPGMNLLNKGITYVNNSNTNFLNLRAKYPNGSYNAGYEGVTRIVTDGAKTMDGTDVSVSNASYVMLLSLTQRYNGTYNGGVTAETEWDRQLLQSRLSAINDDYQTLLNRHATKHREIFNRVSIDFGATAQDRAKSNEQLLAEQKASAVPIPALYERMFYAGRYHLLASSNETAAPDLLGNWTGDSNVGWDGYYHLDANLNLQISSGNIGNMPEAMAGYFYLNQQWQKDFRTNASKLLGTRGMLTGGNTPNEEGLISNINFDYPYQYVTGGESWLLYPFWEYYEVTGDKTFLANQYYPLIRDMGDFYEDFLVKKDANGKYILAGSISPENQPPGGVPLTVNSVYDISGARFALSTLIQTSTVLGRDSDKIPVWQERLDHLPPYIINNDGALAEWAWPGLATSHYNNHSVFATDVVNSVPTVMMEMLAATKPGTLELLPALPNGPKKGSISGMLGKSQFTINNLTWDMDNRTVKVTLTSNIDQNLTLIQRSGIESITSDGVAIQNSPLGGIARVLPLQQGRTVTVNLTLTASRVNLALGKPASASSESNSEQTAGKAFDGDLSTRWSASQNPDNWLQVDLGGTYNLSEVDLRWEASYAKAYKLQASTDGTTWRDMYTQSNSPGGTEKLPVSGQARYVRMQGIQMSGQWGYSLYEMQVYG